MPSRAPEIDPGDEALKWAREVWPFNEFSVRRSEPWAKSYTLFSGTARASLSLVPPRMAHALDGVAYLARRFPALVPAVIALDHQRSALLLQDPGVHPLDTDDDAQCVAFLTGYAEFQSQTKHMPELVSQFPALELGSLLPALLRFLDPLQDTAGNGSSLGAGSLLGESRRDGYRNAIAPRAALIEPLLIKAARLPATIDLGALQMESVAWRSDGTLAIAEWECAVAGPAGMALHGLFGGCANVAAVLAGSIDHSAEPSGRGSRLILSYVDALEAGRYASRRDIVDGLPGVVCAGVIYGILKYRECADCHAIDRKLARRRIQSGLSDLLDLCDLLALADRDTAFVCASDYRQNGRPARAERILRGYASTHRSDARAHVLLAELLHETGPLDIAILAYELSVKLARDDAESHLKLGGALLEVLRYDDAELALREARRLGADAAQVDERLALLAELRQCEDDARSDGMIPAVGLPQSERDAGLWHPARLALAARLFRRYGVLVIRDAFDPDLLRNCGVYFSQHYREYFTGRARPDALNIGDRRFQIGISLEGAFNNPGVYANPPILALMQDILGDGFILGCTVCATSLPGAKAQHLHKDHQALFTADVAGQAVALPPFAVTLMVPLVSLDEQIGTTSVKKGSHLCDEHDSKRMPSQLPLVSLGSCFLMDMRLSHRGLANRTEIVRPILNLVYQRSWFADTRNFTKHPPLRVPPAEYGLIPDAHRRLLVWATHPGPQVNR